MSVLVAAAVLFYLVENRPQAKPVVQAKPAASTESPVQPAPAHKAAVKRAKPAAAPAVKPATVPVSVAAESGATTPPTTAAASGSGSVTKSAPPPPPATVPGPSLMGVLPRTD
jgi:hypothetical protein